MFFWEKEQNKKNGRAVFYGRYSAQGRQENSIEIQRDAAYAWAEKNGVEIVAEYVDAGISGTTANRPGFQAVHERVKLGDINIIICNDPTRWGRFPDPNTAAVYEAKCAEYGARVKYVIHGDLKKEEKEELEQIKIKKVRRKKNDLGLSLLKTLGHAMAGEYSYQLSEKVFDGAVKVSLQGNRAGGPAPYGTLRLEVNEQREPVGTMKPKQHKSYPNHRVKLTPDVEGNATVIREIFELFVSQNHTEKQIAAILNERNISAPKGGKWRVAGIRNILKNEQYAGSVVYYKTSSKIGMEGTIRIPEEDWIKVPNSYEPVVDPTIFETAQAIFSLRKQRMSREEMQDRLRFTIKKYGMLSKALLKSISATANMPDMPSARDITKEFGSLPEAHCSLYPDVLDKTRNDVRKMIEELADDVQEYEDFLAINKMFTVKIVPVIPFPRGYGFLWDFRIDQRPRVDVTLGVALRDCQGSQILGYFPFVRVLTRLPLESFFDSSKFKIGLYGYLDLRFIFNLIRLTNTSNKGDQT